MHSAWEQLGEVESANRRLRELQMARATATSLHRRHPSAMPPAELVQMLAPAASRLPVAEGTLHAEAHGSMLPDGALGVSSQPTRPTGRLERSATGEGNRPHRRDGAFSRGALRPMSAWGAPDGAVLAPGWTSSSPRVVGPSSPHPVGSSSPATSCRGSPSSPLLWTCPPRLPAVIARPSSGVVFRRRIDDIHHRGILDAERP